MTKHPPCLGFLLKQGVQHEERIQRLVRCLQRPAHIHRHLGALARMHQHQIMEVIARQKQRLPHGATVSLRERRERLCVPGAEDIWERAVDGAKVGDELGLMARRRADGHVQAARRANGLLHEVGQRPGAADVGRVGGVVRDDAAGGGVARGGLVKEVVDVDVCVRRVGRQAEQHGEERVLQQHGLPELAALVLFKDAGLGLGDVGVAVQAHRVRLAHQNAGKGPAVGRVVVVDQEVDHEHHGLDGADRRDGQVRGQAQGLVCGRGVRLRGVAFAACQVGVGRHLELRGEAVDDKQERHKGRVKGTARLDREGPKVLVLVAEGVAVEHRVDGVHAVKVEGHEDVARLAAGHHDNDLVDAPVVCPDVGEGMGAGDAEDVGAGRHGVGDIREQARGEGHGGPGQVVVAGEHTAVCNVWDGGSGVVLWAGLLLGRLGCASATGRGARRLLQQIGDLRILAHSLPLDAC